MHALGGEQVARGLELLVVVDREFEHAARFVDASADLLGVADRELLPSALETPVERVLADDPHRRGRGDHGGGAVVAVHQQHIRADGVAADLDVLGQRREHPHAPAAVQAAGRFEVEARLPSSWSTNWNASSFCTIR